MTAKQKRGSRSSQRTRPNRILIFAEDPHDSSALKCLIEALNPQLVQGTQLRVRREPGSLTRAALPPAVKSWMEQIDGVVRAESKLAEITGVLVHQDSDASDAGNLVTLQQALDKHISTTAHPVVPVQEMESWWFLYPKSFRSVKPQAWRDVKLPSNRDVETITDPKEDLIRRTRKEAPKDVYAEAHSLSVAQKMAQAIGRGEVPENRSASWCRFVELAQSLGS